MTDAGRAAPTRAGHRPLGIFLGALVVLGTYVLGSGRLGLAVAWATVTPRGGAATQTALVSPVPGRSATLGWTSTPSAPVSAPASAPPIARRQPPPPAAGRRPAQRSSPPAWPGATPICGGTGVIAFTSYRDGNPEVQRMAVEGSSLMRLTYTEPEGRSPSWSPDGHWLAFMSRRGGNPEIHVMAPDSTQRRRLTNDPAFDEFPRQSPDGSLILFDSDRTGPFQIFQMQPDGHSEIYGMRADGTELRQITTDPADDYSPDWQKQNPVGAMESRADT